MQDLYGTADTRRLVVKTAAKINLTLDVLARREDGYHELASVVHTIGLWDTLTFEFRDSPGLVFQCSDPLLRGDDNLCLKAARAWMATAGRSDLGVDLTLRKHIPHGAGLGGGSSDAAATLVALNRHYKLPLDGATMRQLAARIGADVPLFLRGGCVLMEGIGEIITPLPALAGWVVVLKPPGGMSTPAVYGAWDTLGRASRAASRAMCDAIHSGSIERVAKALQNDLFYAAECLGRDDVVSLRDRLCSAGAMGSTMSGSGSAVFGLFETEASASSAARTLVAADNEGRADYQVWALPLVAAGMEFEGADMLSVQ